MQLVNSFIIDQIHHVYVDSFNIYLNNIVQYFTFIIVQPVWQLANIIYSILSICTFKLNKLKLK